MVWNINLLQQQTNIKHRKEIWDMCIVSGKNGKNQMNITKYTQQIKSIYQDTSTEHDLQLKRVIEQISEEEYNRGWEDSDQGENTATISRTEEREEAEA